MLGTLCNMLTNYGKSCLAQCVGFVTQLCQSLLGMLCKNCYTIMHCVKFLDKIMTNPTGTLSEICDKHMTHAKSRLPG